MVMRIFLLIFFLVSSISLTAQYHKNKLVDTVYSFIEHGGRVDWCKTNNKIVLDKMNGRTIDIYSINPDGTDTLNLTKEMDSIVISGELVEKWQQKGHPAWHPNGKYIVFQVNNRHASNPPKMTDWLLLGGNFDLWVMNSDGSNKTKLTNNNAGYGVLHPVFSRDGKKLMWGEKYSSESEAGNFGSWYIVVGNFVVDENNNFSVTDTFRIQPFGPIWYEANDFSADGKGIYFSSNYQTHKKSSAIFYYDFESKTANPIESSEKQWNEMCRLNPVNEKEYGFISSRFYKWSPGWGWMGLRSDLFLNKNGKEQRITFSNQGEKKNKLSDLHYLVMDYCWSPDGKSLLVLQYGFKIGKFESKLLMIKLKE
jgi:Tol biopolymer transport system component